MKRFHAFVSPATGSIMNIFRILTRAHTLSIFLLDTTDDYNKKLPSSSSPAYLAFLKAFMELGHLDSS
jgi:hypothetical protein